MTLTLSIFALLFPLLDGPNEFEPAAQYVVDVFESLNRNPSKPIYSHIASATNMDQVRHVFNAVSDIVVRQRLKEEGLLVN